MSKDIEDDIIALRVYKSFRRICGGGIRVRSRSSIQEIHHHPLNTCNEIGQTQTQTQENLNPGRVLVCNCHASLRRYSSSFYNHSSASSFTAPPVQEKVKGKGKGKTSTCINSDANIGSDSSNEWLVHLKELTVQSVSYPNGMESSIQVCQDAQNDETSSGENQKQKHLNKHKHQPKIFADDSDIGKPHDVEIRLALSFFHRYKHKCRTPGIKKMRKRGREEEKENENGIKSETNVENEPQHHHQHLPLLEIISDMGLVRSIESPLELASYLVHDMEDMIWHERNRRHNTSTNKESINTNYFSHNIKAQKSGIICMVTPQRVQFLRSIGRLPCSQSYCIKWLKFDKGLRWHEQTQHDIDYSDAATMASSSVGVNELSIVEYRHANKNMDADGGGDGDEHIQPRSGSRIQAQDGENSKEDIYFQTIKDGNLRELEKLLADSTVTKYDAITHLDKNGASGLHWAAGSGHLHIVKYLIEEKSCPPDQAQKGKRSFRNRTPLHWSCRNGHLDVVKYLTEPCSHRRSQDKSLGRGNVDLDAATIDGTTAFCWACWQGHRDVMEYLYEKGANVNVVNSFGCNAVLWSAQGGQEVEGRGQQGQKGSTADASIDAADVSVGNGLFSSSLLQIAWLKSIGVNTALVNSNGHGVLHKAAQRGKEDVCRWFVANHYDPSTAGTCKNSFKAQRGREMLKLMSPDAEQCCPSDLAGMEGYMHLAQWLVCQERQVASEAYENYLKTQSAIEVSGNGNGNSISSISDSHQLPTWLVAGIDECRHVANRYGLHDKYEMGAGRKKMCSYIYENILSKR